MLVSAHNARVSETLQDTSNVTWTVTQLIEWLNDALRALTLVRPDASSVTTNLLLTANETRQTLPAATDLRLIKVVCNMGQSGTAAGDAVRLGSIDSLDAFLPGWRAVTGAVAIKEYVFDEARPDEFEVYPRPHATTPVYVRIIKSTLPAVMTVAGDTISVKDIYGPALIEWCCYRAFSRDSENTPNWQRGARHFAAFFNLLQIKMQADMAINPKFRAMAEKP